ncbi:MULTISPECIES: LysR substrate-binding domain-containing protein [unclassified Gordonia (in: high G+C Gram-positive bacteria)]|uniref:LysR family transcriptional regulator n=1 Tax=unclassified Gordonia (in: high G+C Gram-positive bacteria) TaxID=2657482 RepID=UPI0015533C8B|nr:MULTISPECIES: LysR substrate-binding domain-containing protein [unclassified Gordonia (in: high G+C Gram-positive bacteria)]MDF3283238.1 LysR substrate-binding domain-containing protein [Gordonia sp. N1V]
MDLHTRKLRAFVVLAEELNFSRAAAQLFLAQQALSRLIREVEDEVGATLFTRTTRKVELTPAGVAFRDGAVAALAALDRASAEALRRERAISGTLHLGYTVGAALELTEPILSEFRSQFPDVELETREYSLADPDAGLISGFADVSIIRLPVSTPDLYTEPLFTEPLVALVSTGHRLAGRQSVRADELLDDPVTLSELEDPARREFWTLAAFRAPDSPAVVVPVGTVTEEVQTVGTGGAIAITAAAAARYLPFPGIKHLPISDAPGSVVALAWTQRATSLVTRFVEVALVVRDRQADLVNEIEHPDVRS